MGEIVTITFPTSGVASPFARTFYKYWLWSGYQTPDFGNLQMLQDWSTASLLWTPMAEDHYAILAWATDNVNSGNFHQAGLSIETAGNSADPILITRLTSDISYPQTAGTAVNLNTTATGGSGTLYYK